MSDAFTIVRTAPPEEIALRPLEAVAHARILAFCPTYRIEPETVQALIAQEWEGCYDVTFGRDNPFSVSDGGRNNITWQYSRARVAAIDGGYDGLFIVESDVIPPLDALKRLAVLPSDIAYGEYLFRRTYRVSDWDPNIELYNSSVFRYVIGPDPDESLSLHADEWGETYGRATRCTGGGLGCVLVWRQVFKEIHFSYSETSHCDTMFTKAVHKAGFTMMADRSVKCGHKMPDGDILYPVSMPGYARKVTGILDGYRGELKDDPTKQ